MLGVDGVVYVVECSIFASASVNHICDWIYGNRSKSHIGSYEIIDFKDFNTL